MLTYLEALIPQIPHHHLVDFIQEYTWSTVFVIVILIVLVKWIRREQKPVMFKPRYLRGSTPERNRDKIMQATKRVFKFGKEVLQLRGPTDRPRTSLMEHSESTLFTPNITEPKRASLLPYEIRSIFHEALSADLEAYLESDVQRISLRHGEELYDKSASREYRLQADLYSVCSGNVEVYELESGVSLGVLEAGQCLSSLLNLVNILTGGTISTDCIVGARAREGGAVVAKINLQSFKRAIDDHPQALVQLVRVVARRLQRITFLVMYRYLGLSSELVQQPAPVSTSRVSGSSSPESETVDVSDLKLQASIKVAKLLGIERHAKRVEYVGNLLEIKKGATIVQQGSSSSDVYFVMSGKVVLTVAGPIRESVLYEVLPGQMFGELSVLSSTGSFFTARVATETAFVFCLSRNKCVEIITEYPQALSSIAQMLLSCMTHLVLLLDYGLQWKYLNAGDSLFRQGDDAFDWYVVLNGRLRAFSQSLNGKKEIVREYGRHDTLGEFEMLTESTRPSNVVAVRDTEVVAISSGLFDLIQQKHPAVVRHLIKFVASPSSQEPRGIINITTVAIIPNSDHVPIRPFLMDLEVALAEHCPTLRLSRQSVPRLSGIDCDTPQRSVRAADLADWLSDQEEQHDVVIYQCDSAMTEWTKRCLRQADIVFVVALASASPNQTALEMQVVKFAGKVQKELVLLHPINTKTPSNTADWLIERQWLNRHHHIRTTAASQSQEEDDEDEDHQNPLEKTFSSTYRMRSQSVGPNEEPEHIMRLTDTGRLARRITGTSIGVVLSGGGAKGIAHLGALAAFEEAGIPIDIIGGTSMGAYVGAMYAEDFKGGEIANMMSRMRKYSNAMGNYIAQLVDITLPIVALVRGRYFNRVLSDAFKDKGIEDLWLPYFCVSTDISGMDLRVHRQGSLWRYVRASMSLVGLLPPICDPVDGHYLIDGGFVDNLPVATMRRLFGIETIIAIDVGFPESPNLYNFGDELNGFWVLLQRWNPFRKEKPIATLPEIAYRLSFIRNALHNSQRSATENFVNITPPVQNFTTLQWTAYEEIEQIGYDHVKPLVMNWKETKTFPCLRPHPSSLRADQVDLQRRRSRNSSQ